jgi:hypothetical protein
MVKEGAQLYTMEGIAAGLIMLLTTYLVLGSTSVYTPGDTHITDMQLEQVGSDILRVMDTPLNLTNSLAPNNRTDLELMVSTTNRAEFNKEFMNRYLCNPNSVAKEISVMCNDIQINASIWYMSNSNSLGSYLLYNPTSGSYTGIGPGIRVTHWVLSNVTSGRPSDMRTEPQELLVEVLIWKA